MHAWRGICWHAAQRRIAHVARWRLAGKVRALACCLRAACAHLITMSVTMSGPTCHPLRAAPLLHARPCNHDEECRQYVGIALVSTCPLSLLVSSRRSFTDPPKTLCTKRLSWLQHGLMNTDAIPIGRMYPGVCLLVYVHVFVCVCVCISCNIAVCIRALLCVLLPSKP